jgi:ribokinase
MPTAPRIIVVGSSNTDLVLACETLPSPGETQLGGRFQQFPGGKGANQAVALARGGASVKFIGGCGDDAFGAAARETLEKDGLDLRGFLTKPGINSGVALILLGGESRENLIGVAHSANNQVSPADLDFLEGEGFLADADAILAQLEIPMETVEAAAAKAEAAGIPFILNPAPAPRQALSPELLRRTRLLVPNEGEALALAGAETLEKAVETLLEFGGGRMSLVITLGARGALVCEPGKAPVEVPGRPVKVVDTVGAGDCFCAWLTLGLVEGLDLPASARRASIAASLAVSREGAQPALPRREEVEALESV